MYAVTKETNVIFSMQVKDLSQQKKKTIPCVQHSLLLSFVEERCTLHCTLHLLIVAEMLESVQKKKVLNVQRFEDDAIFVYEDT